ncbi:fiber (DUF1218) [Rhynchospora pubera]|uniref:Fiber (DUF1218) n=1 Tax=Rhynchospora pubera TaxID=906938 RepID=A0AAV8EU75_9POAL|nr:fiber (DUF1218) [Rhynchospora pubera]
MGSKLVISLVLVFDLIAFGLAIAAEQRRSTATVVADNEKNYTYCVYDSDIATWFGVGALLFLFLSQVLVMGATKCFCCGSAMRPGGSRSCALILFFVCWLTFLIAEASLLAGAVRNAYHTRYRTLFFVDPPTCQTVRRGVFAAGAAFIFFTTILTELYYITFSKAQNTMNPSYDKNNIGMGTY